MARVPQNIFFWNALAAFGKLRNPTPLTPTTTYAETFTSISIHIGSLLLLLKNCTSNIKLPSLNFKQISSNFINK
jgi:hypothetical protein